MTKIKIGIAIALIAGVGTLGYLYRAELQKGARQAAVIIQQRAEIEDKQTRIEDLARQREAADAVAAREKARATAIRHETRELRYEIQQLENIEAVRDWGDTHMPREQYDLLRGHTDDRPD